MALAYNVLSLLRLYYTDLVSEELFLVPAPFCCFLDEGRSPSGRPQVRNFPGCLGRTPTIVPVPGHSLGCRGAPGCCDRTASRFAACVGVGRWRRRRVGMCCGFRQDIQHSKRSGVLPWWRSCSVDRAAARMSVRVRTRVEAVVKAAFWCDHGHENGGYIKVCSVRQSRIDPYTVTISNARNCCSLRRSTGVGLQR